MFDSTPQYAIFPGCRNMMCVRHILCLHGVSAALKYGTISLQLWFVVSQAKTASQVSQAGLLTATRLGGLRFAQGMLASRPAASTACPHGQSISSKALDNHAT